MAFIVSPSSFFPPLYLSTYSSPRLPPTFFLRTQPSITTREELRESGVDYYRQDRICNAQQPYPPSHPRLPGRRMSYDYNADNVENGLWSVSVAQTPHDGRLYNVYIKTPSHNLTLTRTMIEIVELDAKIRSKAPPGICVPPLPTITTMPTKRRSTFLKALSKLSKKRSGSSLASTVSTSPSPLVEKADPFLACSAHSSTAANIASYLTTISNVPTLRTTRAFKRFVYVQTDDLQSTRTERPFKRMRPKLPNLFSETGEEEPGVAGAPTHRAYRSHSAAQMSPSSLGQDELSSEASVSEDDVSSKPPPRARPKPIGIDDFDLMRVLGKGCAGKVLLVRKKDTKEHYALKAITKRHVVAHQELSHTLTEQAILKRLSVGDGERQHPFLVKLWWSFHDRENLFLVLDFHPGGDLATQLARWGRLGKDRARFYAAEIVEGLEALHSEGVIYRDLKPENVLIGRDGHVVLTDFGLAKEFPRSLSVKEMLTTAPSTPVGGARRLVTSTGYAYGEFPWMDSETPSGRDFTATFCGTAEYLAPEMILGRAYSYRVDWWALGTLLYEMLVGITPFWGQTQSEMYARVLEDDLCFPDTKSLDEDTKTLLRGLLERNPSLRLSEPRIKQQAYFSMIDWSHVHHKRYIPPYIPPTDPLNADDTQNFDHMFLDMDPVLDGAPVDVFEVFDSPPHGDLFDGYSFRGGNSSDEELVTDTDTDADVDTISMHYPPSLSSSLSHNATEAAHIRQDILDAWSSTSVSMAENAPILEDDDEDDWDVIDRGGHGEARNGTRGPTLMARGVVDRYRLAFRKSGQERSPALRKTQFGNGSRSGLRSSLSKVSLPPSFGRKAKRTSEPVSPLLPRPIMASLSSRGESLRDGVGHKADVKKRQNLEKLYLHFSPLNSGRT